MSSAEVFYRVEVASADAFDVREFRVQERISTLFHVGLVALSKDTDLDFESIAGKPASFELGSPDLGRKRVWSGVCSQIQQVRAEPHGLSTYEIAIVPSLWLATQRRNYRVFQGMSEPDMVRELLSEWGIEAEVRLRDAYRKRKYRIQYGESDFAFICRMLEDAGISFYFDREGGASALVLDDAPQSQEPRTPALPFRDNPTATDREHVTALRVGRRVRPGRATVADHDYRRPPSYALRKSASGGGAVEASLESFDYLPGGFLYESDQGDSTPVADDQGKYRADEREGDRVSQRRLEAERAAAKTCSFDATALDVAPGTVVRIADHPRGELDGRPLLVLATSIFGGSNTEWINRCEACDAADAYRPPLVTPKPRVSGVESATVVGPPGEEIHTDEFGRVRVQFHWDRRGGMDNRSSCWIHVSQPWAGAGYGGINLPRVGHEVLVDFLSGDPDRPVVVGRLYTNLQRVPYKLPDNKTQSGWKSHSSPATGGYNEIMFEDAAGKELIRIQAERDLHRLVKHDEQDVVVHDRTRAVGNNEALAVGKNRTRVVGGNEDVSIALNESETIGVNRHIHVGANHVEAIGSAMTITIGTVKTETVAKESHETVGTKKIVKIGDLHTVTCGSGSLAMDKAGNVSVSAANISLSSSGPVTIQAGSDVTIQAGGNVSVSAGGDVKVAAAGNVDVQAGGNVNAHAGGDVGARAEGNAEVQAGGNAKIQAGGVVKIVGGVIQAN